ncbi:MAG: hypothetical protein Q4E28_03540 [Clostridia bacterium]|nr:hypothetical protein [Clostridia bacterium]
MYLAFVKNLEGKIYVPSSKSEILRYLFLSILQNETKTIYHNNLCKDVMSALKCINNLGIKIQLSQTGIRIIPNINFDKNKIYNFNPEDSAFVYRFFLLFCAFFELKAVFHLSDSLKNRPIYDIEKIFDENHIKFEKKSNLFIIQSGKIENKNFNMKNPLTSQTISSLLILQTYFDDIKITVDDYKNGYIDLTKDLIKKISKSNEVLADGDFSSASYLMSASALGGNLEFANLNLNSKQPDKKIIDILKQYGAKIEKNQDSIIISKAQDKKALTVDVDDCIDLFPTLVMLFAFTNGESTLKNINRAKIKETNRVLAATKALETFGINYNLTETDLIIDGVETLKEKQFELPTFFDHRMAMSYFIPTVLDKYIILDDIDCIQKSYKNFILDYHNCKGEVLAKL